jgi:hypothetical protein
MEETTECEYEIVIVKPGEDLVTRTATGRELVLHAVDYHSYMNSEKRSVEGNLFDETGQQYFADQLLSDIKGGYSPIVMVTGNEGAGKSTYVLTQAPLVSPTFSVDDVCFTTEAFVDRNKVKSRGESIVDDEAGHGLFKQEWYNSWQKTVYKLAQVQRKRQVIWWLVIPHKDDLNSSFQRRRVDYWVDIYTKGRKKSRGYAEVWEGSKNKWKKFIWWNPMIAFTFSPLKGKSWDDYNARKDVFIESALVGALDLDKYSARYVNQRNRLAKTLHDGHNGKDGWTMQEIGDKLGVTRMGVSKMIANAILEEKYGQTQSSGDETGDTVSG